jgi:hypothetical protein
MLSLPPKGKVDLDDLVVMYKICAKPFMYSQFEEIIFRIYSDMVESLENIKKWCKEEGVFCVDDDGQSGSMEMHLRRLQSAKNIQEMIVAIDNCLNDYHGVSMMLENIINADFDEINDFLNKRRGE